jgi:phage RecT family recombinase
MPFTPEESMKYQEEFAKLPKDEQDKIRAQQAMEWESQKTSLAKVKTYAELDEVKKRFINLLGEAGGKSYVESVVIAVSNNQALQRCSPKSIFVSAMRAASLKLSVDPALRQAHLVPYGEDATLIVDYHGLLTLSTNTGYYEKAPHVSEVYSGETVKMNRFTGEVTVEGQKESDEIIGWLAYFKAKNGTERWEYKLMRTPQSTIQMDSRTRKAYGIRNARKCAEKLCFASCLRSGETSHPK